MARTAASRRRQKERRQKKREQKKQAGIRLVDDSYNELLADIHNEHNVKG